MNYNAVKASNTTGFITTSGVDTGERGLKVTNPPLSLN